jgi:DnaK suppressor protein
LRTDAEDPKEIHRAAHARMRTELRRVDAAFVRLEMGRYGACCRCRERLEIRCLESDPATPFCLPCLEEMAEDREAALLRR